jgi:hypothetical protein
MSEQSHIAEVAADLAKAAELHMPAMVIMVHQLRAVYDHADALEVRATAAEAREVKLREALEPFAKAGAIRLVGGDDYWTDDRRIQGTDIAFHITFGDLRQARAALETDNG